MTKIILCSGVLHTAIFLHSYGVLDAAKFTECHGVLKTVRISKDSLAQINYIVMEYSIMSNLLGI